MFNCSKDPKQAVEENKLFTSIAPDGSGIDFQNVIQEGLNTNVLMYEYFPHPNGE
jgi:hypothetical protein